MMVIALTRCQKVKSRREREMSRSVFWFEKRTKSFAKNNREICNFLQFPMATSFFYIYVMATSFCYIQVIYIDIYILFTNWQSIQSFYWTPFLGLEDLEKQSTMFWKSTYILLGLPMCEVVHPQDTQIWGLGPTFILRLISFIWIFNKGEWRQTCKRCWWKVFITAGLCKLYLPIGIQSAPVMIWVRIYSG